MICLSLARIWLFPRSGERSAERTVFRVFLQILLFIDSISANRLIGRIWHVFMSMISNPIQPFVIDRIVIILCNLVLWEKIQSFPQTMFSLKVCVFASIHPNHSVPGHGFLLSR